jgi:hypothetical protein
MATNPKLAEAEIAFLAAGQTRGPLNLGEMVLLERIVDLAGEEAPALLRKIAFSWPG